MDDRYIMEVYHGGHFESVHGKTVRYTGEMSEWSIDEDRWGYFEIKNILKKLGYLKWEDLLYKIGGKELHHGMKFLTDDRGALEMANVAKCWGKVQLYIVHSVDMMTQSQSATQFGLAQNQQSKRKRKQKAPSTPTPTSSQTTPPPIPTPSHPVPPPTSTTTQPSNATLALTATTLLRKN